jgi:hypothetical protein
MQTKFTKYFSYTLLIILLCVTSAGMLFTSCDKDDEGDNGTTVLKSFGPMPVARGAELRFIGKNLDKVTAIVLPGGIEIPVAQFTSASATLLTITVPQNAIEGKITLVTPDGNIETKTEMGFSEPISISDFSPAIIKADSVLTINGDYLNLVTEVIFTDRVAVNEADFITHTRYQIQVPVPHEAQTGKISVSNGEEDPIIVYSTGILNVKLPVINKIDPNPVKAGTLLTITGNHLDLVTNIKFGGNITVNNSVFLYQRIDTIKLTVPENTQDGILTLQPASGVSVESATPLIMIVPTVSVTPTTLKNGTDITVTGTDLDLVDKVIFGNNKEGTIKAGRTETQIEVTSPIDAKSGIVQFVTKANKTVNGAELTFVKPVITNIAPLIVQTNDNITITGTDLDLVSKINFTGGTSAKVTGATATQIVIAVPYSTQSGKITLLTKNGDLVESSQLLDVSLIVPTITNWPSVAFLGSTITITGTNLDLAADIIFPGDITATMFVVKNSTTIEVYVPIKTTKGVGKIKFKTINEEILTSPDITFKMSGPDPIADPNLIINDFDETGHDLGWDNWGGNLELGSDPTIAFTGKYAHGIKASCAGWAWLWGCNHEQLVKKSVTRDDHVLKIDINISTAFVGNHNFQMKIAGTTIDLGKFGTDDGRRTDLLRSF